MKFVRSFVIFLISALLLLSQSPQSLTALAEVGGISAGGFISAKRITMYGNMLVITDGGSDNEDTPNQVQIVDKSRLGESDCAYNVGVFGTADNGLVNPLISITDGSIIYTYYTHTSPAAHRIKQFDMEGNVIKPNPNSSGEEPSGTSFTKVVNLDQYFDNTQIDNINLKAISDMTVDSFGNVYAAMYWSKNTSDFGAIIKRTASGFEMIDIDTTLLGNTPLISPKSRLFPSSDTNNMIVASDTSIVIIDIVLKKVIYKKDLTTSLDFNDISTDYKNNLYFYKYGGVYTHTITKLNAPEYNTQTIFDIGSNNAETSYDKADNNLEIKGFAFDKVTAEGYLLSDSDIFEIDMSDVVEHLKDFEKPDYTQQIFLNSPVQIMKLSSAATGYAYPYAISPEQQFEENDFVFVLGEENNFSYCLVTNKKNYNFTTYLHKNNLTEATAQPAPNPNLTNFFNLKIYKFPTSLMASEEDSSPMTLGELPRNTRIQAIRLIDGEYRDFLKESFYEIKTSEGYYYLNTSALTPYNKDATAEFIRSNAKVNITDGSGVVAIYNEISGTAIYSLQPDTRIRVVGNIDKSKEFTLIEYLDSTDNVAKGYIKTKYIEMDGIEIEIIIAIILIIIAVILAVILIVVSKKNNR